MWIWIANKFAKFRAKRLNRRKTEKYTEKFQGGYFLKHSVDDVSMFAQHSDKTHALTLLQDGVDRVVKWSKAKKMIMNANKSEISFFSNDNREASWIPSKFLVLAIFLLN